VQTQVWLLTAVVLVVMPHIPRLPLWLALSAAVVMLFKLLMLRRTGSQGTLRGLLQLLTLASAGGVYLHYHTLLGRDAGVALLVSMLLLKLLELRTARDAHLVVLLGYFLVITNFLFTQTILIALYMFVTTTVITATLAVIARGDTPRPVRDQLRLAGVLLAQAVPLMLVLFVFFPRIAGPGWGLPEDSNSGMTGLGNSMTPGAISSLAQSDDIAFRVKFIGAAPAAALRYWRGPVLWHTDGRTWTPGRMELKPRIPEQETRYSGTPVRYTVTLEGHDKHWLLALDLPADISVPALHSIDFQFLAYRPVQQRTRYQATSWPRYHTGPLAPRLRSAALQLPGHVSERVQALARDWRSRAADDQAVVQLALDHFNTRPFIYTLQPPLLGNDPVDEFLFSTRRGFCEHYAAAFVVLMRSAGIPARIVTGYQGGEYNPLGDYWLIRQSDAHAWAEVWLPDSGWQRVDPTAAVAPERIENPLDPGAQLAGAPARFRLSEHSLLARGWRGLHHALDALNNSWNEWVLSYGPERQLALLAALGISKASWKHLALILVLLLTVLLLGIALWMLVRKPQEPADPVLRAWRKFCRRLSRLGIERGPGEGPQDLSRRVSSAHPDLAGQVALISGLYIQLRYGRPAHGRRRLAQLQRLVRQFPRRGG
jgi:transglutaminase-like putative cysteine protease